ncbi:MAG: serine/threonine protein kinase, partial [Gemmatimonadetes bacterium]|nr:serine/threonine protein kinase [Gemmatimonadota bacterium]
MAGDLREQLQSTLGGAYTLERELGGGGMSRIFVAHETRLGRTVVVKVLPSGLMAGLSAERFEREIRLVAQLQHPSIVPVLSAGDADGLPYYTMPFVAGLSLRARLADGGTLPVAEAVRILRDVARGLEYAHGRGVVHRDIKPENILIAVDGAVITDFGIAKALDASRSVAGGATLTEAGTMLGTPQYMAPEQVAGDPNADHRADIYAFGATAYEMLGGAAPFAGRAPHQILAAHVSEAPKPIAAVRADTPPGLAALVMRCLEKDPSHRPQSARELLEALEAVGTPTTPHTTPRARSVRLA